MAKALNNQDLIRKLKPNPSQPFYRRAVHSHVGSGLYVKVTSAGGRKYVARYIIQGKPVDVTLGNAMSMSLQEAKDKHVEGYNLAADGRDPRLAWKAQIKSNEQAATMQSLFDEWLQFYSATPGQRSKRVPAKKTVNEHHARWNRYCKEALGPFLVSDIKRAVLMPFLRKLATKVPVEARHQLNVLRAMLSYAEDCQLIEDNVLRGVTASQIGGSAGAIGKRVLTLSEIVQVWMAIDMQEKRGILGKHISTAIKILILTGARREEVSGMRWEELDLNSGVWIIKPARTKNRRGHTIYLAPEAVNLLKNLEALEGNDFVFTGQIRGQAIHAHSINTAIARLLSTTPNRQTQLEMLVDLEHFSPHDLRRSAATGWSRHCNALDFVIEEMLNHTKPRLQETYNKNQHNEQQKNTWHEWAYKVTSSVNQAYSRITPHNCHVADLNIALTAQHDTEIKPQISMPSDQLTAHSTPIEETKILDKNSQQSHIANTLINEISSWLTNQELDKKSAAKTLGIPVKLLTKLEQKSTTYFTIDVLVKLLERIGKRIEFSIHDR